MMNEAFIISSLKPFYSDYNEISIAEINEVFPEFTTDEVNQVIKILKNIGVKYIEEKEDDQKYKRKINNFKISNSGDYKKYKSLTNEQLCSLYQNGDKNALSALVEKNEKFIYKFCAKYVKYLKQDLEIEELFQFGAIGLINAANKFDIKMNNKFVTYAGWWIRQNITRGIADFGYAIRIPVHMFEVVNRILKYKGEANELNNSDLYQYIINEEKKRGKEISIEKINQCLFIAENYMKIASLNTLVGNDADSELIEFIPYDDSALTEEIAEHHDLQEILTKALKTLKPREEDVVRKRFGLDKGRPMVLEEIGQEYGVTRERIRQIEAKALRKLRKSGVVKYFVDYY